MDQVSEFVEEHRPTVQGMSISGTTAVCRNNISEIQILDKQTYLKTFLSNFGTLGCYHYLLFQLFTKQNIIMALYMTFKHGQL